MNTDNVVEWKLVDVPELGYFTSDKPFPRGELVLKTRGLIKGYFKHPKVRNDRPSLVMRGPGRYIARHAFWCLPSRSCAWLGCGDGLRCYAWHFILGLDQADFVA